LDKKCGNYITRSFMICTAHQIFSGDQIEKTEIFMIWSTYGESRGAYRVLVGKSEGKRLLGRTRRR